MSRMELLNLCELIVDCPHSTAQDEGEGFPLIRTPNIGKGRLLLDGVHRVSKQVYDDRNKRAIPQEDDLIFAREATPGNVAIIKKEKVCLGQRTVLIRPNKLVIDSSFLMYYMLSPKIQHDLLKTANGSTVNHVNMSQIRKLKIKSLPKLEMQKQISHILEAYDLKIENNNKRIKILEQMVEELYKEWFVRCRFPSNEYYDHKDIFKYYKIHELCSFSRGISYSSDEINCEEGLDLINLKNINAFGGFRRDGYKKYNGKYKDTHIVNTGDLVMGITDMTQDRRTVGSVALIPTTNNLSVISADLVKINSNVNNQYLYCLFKYGEISKYISQFANGSNVLHLRPNMIKNVLIPVAKEDLIDKFVRIVEPLFKEMEFLYLKNDNLIKQRDLLLPRLMSGKLEVK